jgi:methylmalonyl-CoA mutase N-terminal domain/subunit
VFRVRQDHGQGETQEQALARLRESRDEAAVRRGLEAVGAAARSRDNTLPALLEAARARVTLGEIVAEFEQVFGRYTPSRIAA